MKTQTHKENAVWQQRQRLEGSIRERQGLPSKHRSWAEAREASAQSQRVPADTLISDLESPNSVVLSHPVCDHLLQEPKKPIHLDMQQS